MSNGPYLTHPRPQQRAINKYSGSYCDAGKKIISTHFDQVPFEMKYCAQATHRENVHGKGQKFSWRSGSKPISSNQEYMISLREAETSQNGFPFLWYQKNQPKGGCRQKKQVPRGGDSKQDTEPKSNFSYIEKQVMEWGGSEHRWIFDSDPTRYMMKITDWIT